MQGEGEAPRLAESLPQGLLEGGHPSTCEAGFSSLQTTHLPQHACFTSEAAASMPCEHLPLRRVRAAKGRAIWAYARSRALDLFPAFALGKLHPPGFSSKMLRDKQNLFGWCSLSRWGSTTRTGFRQKCFGTGKTFPGGARFCAGEAPPGRVFVKITPKRGKPFRVVPAFALGATSRRA